MRRGTEVVVTGAPRKRLVGKPARGFESHPLRQIPHSLRLAERVGFRRCAARAAPGSNRRGWDSLPRPCLPTLDSPVPSVGLAQGRLANGAGGTVFGDGDRGVSKWSEMALQVQGREGERLVGAIGIECSRRTLGVGDPAESPSPFFDDEDVGDRRARGRRRACPDDNVAGRASEGELAIALSRARHGRLGDGRRTMRRVTSCPRRPAGTGPRSSSRKILRTFWRSRR